MALGVEAKDLVDYLGFAGDHFVISVVRCCFFHIAITVRRSGKHVDLPRLGPVPFSTAGTLRYLSPFILGNHSLKLEQQVFFGSRSLRRLQENHFAAVAGKLFG